jgi:hypothetical protein
VSHCLSEAECLKAFSIFVVCYSCALLSGSFSMMSMAALTAAADAVELFAEY